MIANRDIPGKEELGEGLTLDKSAIKGQAIVIGFGMFLVLLENLVEKVKGKKIWLLFTRDWENWGRILMRFRTYVPSFLPLSS
jgi:hypothetical protein